MPSVELPLFKHPVAGGGRFLSSMAITLIALFMAIGPHSVSGADLKRLKEHPKLKWSPKMHEDLSLGRPTKVLVQLKDGAAESTGISIDALMQRGISGKEEKEQVKTRVLGVQKKVIDDVLRGRKFKGRNYQYLNGFAMEASQENLEALLAHDDVLSITEDEILHPDLRQGIALIQAEQHRLRFNGAGVAIAVCDTGIDYTHPDLGNGAFPNTKVIGGYDTGQNDNDPVDKVGHGTCCAGIAAGSAAENGDYLGGIAFNAKLYALKITATDTGTSAYASAVISAWEWCITHQYDAPDHPILVISHSFSGGRYFSQSDCNSDQPLFFAAATAVRAAGITLFVSAGNDGFCESTAKPGCLSNTINVGAVYDSAFGTYRPCVSSDSCVEKYPSPSCGTGYYAEDPTEADRVPSYSNSAAFLTLLAPSNRANTTDIWGVGGYSPENYRSDFGGTSAACPYAAGAAACLQSAALELTGTVLSPDEVEAYLVNNGDPVTDEKSNITTQRVNLRRAIAALTADTPSPIAPPGNFQIVD